MVRLECVPFSPALKPKSLLKLPLWNWIIEGTLRARKHWRAVATSTIEGFSMLSRNPRGFAGKFAGELEMQQDKPS